MGPVSVCSECQEHSLAIPLTYMMLHIQSMLFSAQIDDSVASLIIAQLLFLQSESNNKPIHMYINSPGKMVFFIKSNFGNLPLYLLINQCWIFELFFYLLFYLKHPPFCCFWNLKLKQYLHFNVQYINIRVSYYTTALVSITQDKHKCREKKAADYSVSKKMLMHQITNCQVLF